MIIQARPRIARFVQPIASAPTLVSLSVATGPEAGGTYIEFTGTGFITGTGFTIDGVAVTSVVIINTQLASGYSPAGTGTNVDVVVTNANGSDTLVGGWDYDNTYDTPDLVNNASFESGWDGFTNSGGSADPTGVTRQTDQAYAGSYSAKATWAANVGDVGTASFWKYSFTGQDDLWARFYFRLASGWSINSIQKYCIFRQGGGGTQFGGLELNDALGLSWSFFIEGSAVGTQIKSKASITSDAWHSIEVYYQRNGSTYPWAQFWYDDVLVTHADTSPNAYGIYWDNNELHVSDRGSSAQVGMMQLLGTRNGGNTGSGTIWIDRVAISSLGRIGP